ncbi:MAG: DIP1984 family protein [Candidatus Wallbacteria bacterium]
MKIAEALNLRADAQRKLSELSQRLEKNAQVQEGEKPAENPNKLLAEYEIVLEELNVLVKRINRTNNTVELEPGLTLMEAITDRDHIASRRNALANLKQSATQQQDRYSRTEIKFVSTVDVVAIQKQVDALSKEYRTFDSRIQQMNWQADLIE